MIGHIRRIGNRGFTLMELLAVIVIFGIMAAVALPSLLNAISGSRIDGATRQVMYEIRAVQSMAVTRGGDFGWHWGGDPTPTGRLNSEYRIETDPSGTCTPAPTGWPAPGDTTATVYPLDPNPPGSIQRVIRDWYDLAGEYQGVTIQSVTDNAGNPVGGVMFNSRGASMNTCTAVTFPLTVTIADTAGVTRTIQVERAGRVRII